MYVTQRTYTNMRNRHVITISNLQLGGAIVVFNKIEFANIRSDMVRCTGVKVPGRVDYCG